MTLDDRSPVIWPDGNAVAVALTFDFDAEELWLGNDPTCGDQLGVMALGHYGAKVGVPKILDLLTEEDLSATFFIPGAVAERYPGHVREIRDRGHEVAHHGHTHIPADPSVPGLICEQLDRALEALWVAAEVRPVGYRAPDGVSSEAGFRAMSERGFVYDSSLKDDYRPYRITLADGSASLVELPEQPSFDDWSYGSISPVAYRVLQSKDAVQSIWQDNFDELRRWGGLAMPVMHPQITGRPLRLSTLRDFIEHTRTDDDVWYATCSEIANHFASTER